MRIPEQMPAPLRMQVPRQMPQIAQPRHSPTPTSVSSSSLTFAPRATHQLPFIAMVPRPVRIGTPLSKSWQIRCAFRSVQAWVHRCLPRRWRRFQLPRIAQSSLNGLTAERCKPKRCDGKCSLVRATVFCRDGALHRATKVANLGRHRSWHRAMRIVAFAPVEAHAKTRTAGSAILANWQLVVSIRSDFHRGHCALKLGARQCSSSRRSSHSV